MDFTDNFNMADSTQRPNYLVKLESNVENTADSLMIVDIIDLDQPIVKGSRHTEILKIATLICTEMPADSTIHDFKYRVFKYDVDFCQPPLQNNPKDKVELERIVSDVWDKFQIYRGTSQEVEEKVMQSPDVVKSIQDSIDELNSDFSYVLKTKKIWRFKQRDFISPQDFLVQTSNRRLEVQLKKSIKSIHLGQKWLESKNRRENYDVVFEPGCPPMVENNINLWEGWGVEPIQSKECVTIFNEFLDFIFEEDPKAREWFVKWLAYPIIHPGEKLFSAVLLWGIHGAGKTLMGEIIGRIYGKNYLNINASILKLTYDGWKRNLQFVCGDEICSQDNKRQHNDTLKHLITGNTIPINEKWQPVIVLKNCANFLFTSNHQNAIAIEQTERRFFVWHMPRIIDDKLLEKVVRELLTKRGAAALRFYFINEVNVTDFNPKGMPYKTKALDDMVDTTRSDLEAFLYDIKLDGIEGTQLKSEVATLSDIKIAYELTNTKTTLPAIKNALYRIGIDVDHKRELKIKIGGSRNTVRLIPLTNVDYWNAQDLEIWRDEYLKMR